MSDPDYIEGERFILELSPVGDNVRTARLFGASLARHFDCDEELVEDLKLALSEGMNRALKDAPGAAEPVRVAASKVGDALTFSVHGSGGSGDAPEVEDPSGLGQMEQELIQALFPDATFGTGVWSAEFTVPLV